MKKNALFLSIICCLLMFMACQPDNPRVTIQPQNLLSAARIEAGDLITEEVSIVQNGRVVGVVYIPIKINSTSSVQYWALSNDYVYLNSQPNTKFDYIPSATPSKFATVQDFRAVMKMQFGTGKFIVVNTKEGLLTSSEEPY
ncbi:MAG: hypothetical protein R2822_30845 [Spirosomataceae bacterium]